MTGFKFLIWLLVFFGVIFTANIIMMTFAFNSHPGLVTQTPYKDAKEYNNDLEEAEMQKQSGWKLKITHLPKKVIDDYFSVKISYPKSALPPKSVTVKFIRPALAGHDFSYDLFHRGDNIYAADIKFKIDGVWNVLVTAHTVKLKKYYLKSRLVIEHES